MPMYEYTDGHVTVELVRPVAERDACPHGFRRVTVPARVGVVRGLIDPGTPDAAVPRALREYELTKGHDAIARETGFSTKRMKSIWGL